MNHTEIQIRIDERRNAGASPINLATGAFLLPPSAAVKELMNAFKIDHYNYTSSIGDFKLRNQFAQLLNNEYHSNLSAENIAFVFGGTEGIYLTVAALSQITEWLHVMPGWHTLSTILETLHRKLIPCDYDHFNIDSITPLLNKNLGIFINTPINPTGDMIPLPVLQQIIGLSDIPVLLDMVYEGLTTTPQSNYFKQLITSSLINHDHCTTVFSLSKLFRVAGLRLGVVVAHPQLIQKIAVIKSATTLNMPLNLQALMVELWKLKTDEIRLANHFLLQRDEWLSQKTQQLGLPMMDSLATHYRLLDCKQSVNEIFKFLMKHDIFLAQCHHNGLPRHLRFNLSAELSHLEIFLSTLSKFGEIA